jgi:menaquinone-dependent protoporphyrinogen IX oxidase
MNPAIVYHSRQGHNKALAMSLQEEFEGRGVNATMIRISARRQSGIVKEAIRAILGRSARLESIPDLRDHNPILVCSPIWAGHLTPVFLGFVKTLQSGEGKQFYNLHCCFGDTAGALGRASELLQQKGAEVLGSSYITTSDLLERGKLPIYVADVVDRCVDHCS